MLHLLGHGCVDGSQHQGGAGHIGNLSLGQRLLLRPVVYASEAGKAWVRQLAIIMEVEISLTPEGVFKFSVRASYTY